MPAGGARINSGPTPDPTSGRSEKRGLKVRYLPTKPRTLAPPKWPLPEGDSHERGLWKRLWTEYPQAHAWADEPWRWHDIALYVRYTIRCEEDESQAALASVMFRLRDEIGLGPAGLRANGWVISSDKAVAADEGDGKPPPQPEPEQKRTSARDRLKVNTDG